MSNYKLLVTTSGIGSRLRPFTQEKNKALIELNDKPALSYILDGYSREIPIVITLGYKSDQVVDFVQNNYSDRKVTFVEVDVYEGAGSSCGYSILQAKNELQSPFIFHACDTIIFDPIPPPNSNWTAGYLNTHLEEHIIKKHYTTQTTNELRLLKINPVGEDSYNFVHMGITAIYDYKVFWDTLKKIYLDDPSNSKISDVTVINKMLQAGYVFKTQPFNTWLDIGNLNSFANAQRYFQSAIYERS
jgi:NDP-sugar pyrophosphorylase family protein